MKRRSSENELSSPSSARRTDRGPKNAAQAFRESVNETHQRCFGAWDNLSDKDREAAIRCADGLRDLDPERYDWIADVPEKQKADALCFVAVFEFGRVDQRIANVSDFCGWLHAAVRKTMDLGQRLLGGPSAQCPICIHDMAAADASLILPCLHSGHTNCLKTWLDLKPSCPECRAPTDPKSLFPVHAIGSLAARREMQERPSESDAKKAAREALGLRRALMSRAKDAFLRPIRKLPKIGCVAAGIAGHTVVLMEDGSVRNFVFGRSASSYSKLGGGSVSTPIPGIDGKSDENKAAQVAAGRDHTVVLMKDGSVRVFGDASNDQLGGGSESWPVPGIDGKSDENKAAQVAAGDYHTVVLMKDGSVRAFGDDDGETDRRQLGGGSTSEPIPQIDGTSDENKAAQVAAGGGHTVVLMKDGSVRAFGWNYDGQLGVGSGSVGSASEPIPQIDGTSYEKKAAQVAAGHRHTVVLMKDGSVRAFGDGLFGQLGGGSVEHMIPAIGYAAAQVAAGGYHTVVLMKDGSVFTFGGVFYRGPRMMINNDAAQVAAGVGHTVVLMKDGSVRVFWAGGEQLVPQPIPEIGNNAAKCG